MEQRAYKNYLLTVLLLILAFNNMDRLVLGVVLEDIKADLSLSDGELGFLTGIAFALFYAVMGIPIARWADRGNRVTIIALTTAVWSAAVALCGAATHFVQLLLIRVFVAVGEAGCHPPSFSLIADYFSRGERPRATARYMLGLPLALTVGYFAAGWLNQAYGWRITFALLGAPGLLLAGVAACSLKEPRLGRGLAQQTARPAALDELPAESASSPRLREVLAILWSTAAFRHLLLCYSVWSFFGFGVLQWQPAFFVRSHAMATGELGTWLAVIYGLGGLLGTYLGGELASRHAANNERLQLVATAWLFAVFAVFTAGAYLAPTRHLAFALLAISAVGGAGLYGPLFATIQTLVPGQIRATSIAILFFFGNLIGAGLGPLGVGMLSDGLRPVFAEESLRYTLLLFSSGYLWAALHAWRGSRAIVAKQARSAVPVQVDG